jgi:hypothetical protein
MAAGGGARGSSVTTPPTTRRRRWWTRRWTRSTPTARSDCRRPRRGARASSISPPIGWGWAGSRCTRAIRRPRRRRSEPRASSPISTVMGRRSGSRRRSSSWAWRRGASALAVGVAGGLGGGAWSRRRPSWSSASRRAGVHAPSGALDLDGDGRVDLVENVLPSGVLFADGAGYARPVVDGVEGFGRPVNAVTPMDLDDDGLLDLLVGQPRCDLTTLNLMMATGPRRYLSQQDRVAPAVGEAIVDAVLPMPASAGGPAGVYPISLACDQAAPFPGFYAIDSVDGAPSLRPHDPLPAEPFWG